MRKRRGIIHHRISHVFMGIGILCLVLATGLVAGNQYARYLTRQKQLSIINRFETQLTHMDGNLTQADHVYTGTGKNDYTAIEGETIAILRLDRLGIKVSVAEGTDRQVLKMSAGHFPGTAFPGNGNFAIAGHSSREYVCLFNVLHEAIVGDQIVVTTRTQMHQYLVSDILVVRPEQTEYVCQTNESVLTIVTCTDSGTSRLIIRAVEVT